MNKKLVLAIACLLIVVGLKPDLISFVHPKPAVVETLDIPAPVSETLMEKAKVVVKALSVDNDRKTDGLRLASLYMDMATLVELDGANEVVKNTEDIRQANRLVGPMLKLNIKDKYPDLAEAAQDLVVSAIGDDNVLLNAELRTGAVQGFKALAWACNEGAK